MRKASLQKCPEIDEVKPNQVHNKFSSLVSFLDKRLFLSVVFCYDVSVNFFYSYFLLEVFLMYQ